MRHQPATGSSSAAGPPPPRARPSPDALEDADLDIPILGRADVARVPWVVICAGSLALALSQILRPAGGEAWAYADLLIIGGSILVAVVAGVMVACQDTEVLRSLRGAVWIYLLSAGVLLVSLTVVALADSGLASLGLMAMPFTTAYLGLVLPRSYSRIALAVVMVTLVGIQLARPVDDVLAWGSAFVLVAAGGAIGLLVRHAHQKAREQSLLLSRSDQLTGALNRRGFLEQLGDELRGGRPIALMLVDLNDFKRVNDTEGHAAGDALLAWVGATIPAYLPDDAAFGRLGGDEFAIALPGATTDTVRHIGEQVIAALGDRIAAAAGAAIRPAGEDVDSYSLLQCADTALYAAKHDPDAPVQLRPARVVAAEQDTERPAERPASLTFAQLRAAGGPPQRFVTTLYEGRTIALGFLVVAAAGVPFVVSTIAAGGTSFFERVIQYLGVPWILVNVAIAAYYSRRRYENDRPPLFALYGSSVIVALGICAAALSTGTGVLAPITAGLFIKVFFDFSFGPRRLGLRSVAVVAAFWAAALALGPADALWAAPYQLVLLGAGYMFGTIGQQAFAEATAVRMRLANTDGLTGLLNRRGFEYAAERARQAIDESTESLAVMTFDLDDFKRVNDTLGHAAGDDVLRAVAAATREALPDAYAVGRLGGDEFVAAVPASSLERAVTLADRLDAHLTAVAAGSVGCAFYPADGGTVDELLIAADERAYAVKRARAHRRGR
ncbi:MAG: GGDEF domain-containing protein [Solirubrobacteraceae bacterium]|nr:GGDEF domain-containing protein [Solirubrobacteraceae bacterium]